MNYPLLKIVKILDWVLYTLFLYLEVLTVLFLTYEFEGFWLS